MDEKRRSRKKDLLSDLPLSIIHMILSFVPIRDAIKTSLLSRHWRYIWNSLPHLKFDDKCDNDRLNRFVSQTLFVHEGPINKFELRDSDTEPAYIDQWLIFLSRKDIKILVLGSFFMLHLYQLHSSLYSCQYLTCLELFGFSIPTPPQSFKGFLCLRRLYLRFVEASSETIESIVDHSPLLEELTIDEFRYWEITIRAPNLKYFHSNGEFDRLSLHTPLLEKLIGDLTETKNFSIDAESFYGSLENLCLRIHLTDDTKMTLPVISLINGASNLQSLEISGSSSSRGDASKFTIKSLWDTECIRDFTYDSLKVIKMENFGGEINEMKFIKFLLERSPALEKMIYKPHSSVLDSELLKLMAQLLSYRRASTDAEILIVDDRF